MAKEPTALKVMNDNMTLLDKSGITRNQLVFITKGTPSSQIYKRPGRGGTTFRYVKGSYVKKVLNYVFAWNWDFEVSQFGREENQVWVLGKLTVRDTEGRAIIKQQFGRADIKFMKDSKIMVDYGNDLKAATTDSLKKCASELGIASDVYSDEENKDIKEPSYTPNVPVADPKDDEPLDPAQKSAITNMVAGLSKNGVEVEEFSFDGMTRKQAKAKIVELVNIKK